jgi:hypothetical protein
VSICVIEKNGGPLPLAQEANGTNSTSIGNETDGHRRGLFRKGSPIGDLLRRKHSCTISLRHKHRCSLIQNEECTAALHAARCACIVTSFSEGVFFTFILIFRFF